MNNIKFTPDVTGIQRFVRDDIQQTALPISYQTNVFGQPVSIRPTLSQGGFGLEAVTTFKEGGAVPPRQVDIKGQPHMLAYITPEEGGILQLLGGSGSPGPMGIPSFFMDFGMDDASYSADDSRGDVSSGDDNQPSSGGDTGYSGSITSAMADTSPTGRTGSGGSGGARGGFGVTSTGMGLDDLGIADQVGIMGGLSKGVTGLETMQGSINYSPVKSVPYDLFNLRDKMNRHARASLKKGVQPQFTYDQQGRITSVTGPGGLAGIGVPTPITMLANLITQGFDTTTTTGYNIDAKDQPDGSETAYSGITTLRPREEYQEAVKIRSPLDIYLANPNKFRLFG